VIRHEIELEGSSEWKIPSEPVNIDPDIRKLIVSWEHTKEASRGIGRYLLTKNPSEEKINT